MAIRASNHSSVSRLVDFVYGCNDASSTDLDPNLMIESVGIVCSPYGGALAHPVIISCMYECWEVNGEGIWNVSILSKECGLIFIIRGSTRLLAIL
jgi:hypothetical protein